MIHLFRKLLIRIGKVIPFVFAFIVAFGYMEVIYATHNGLSIVDAEGNQFLKLSVSNFIGNIIYIDWFDVLLLYIIAFALEFCKYNLMAVHYLLLNLAVRFVLEHFYLPNHVLIHLCAFMALLGLYCVYGGFKMIPQQRNKF